MNHLQVLIVKVPSLTTGWRPSIFFFLYIYILKHLLDLEESVELNDYVRAIMYVLNVLICPFLCVISSCFSSDLTLIGHIRLKNMKLLCGKIRYCHFLRVEKSYTVIFHILLCMASPYLLLAHVCIHASYPGSFFLRRIPRPLRNLHTTREHFNGFCMLLRSGERGWRQHY